MRTLSARTARRIALTAMGFGRARPAPGGRRDVRHFRRVVDTVDIVQIDSVNVLARAHELPFWSRLGPHDRTARDRWLWQSREQYEGWIHVASLSSVDIWPLLHHRRAKTTLWEQVREVEQAHPGYLDAVLAEIAEHGPRSIRDLEDPGERTGPWWGMPKGRLVMDWLASRGDLVLHHRTPNFVAVYDLAERVIPAAAREAEVPPLEQAREQLVLRAAAAHGIGTAADLADHHRLVTRDVRPALERLVAAGALEEVRVRGWGDEPVYRHPEAGAARSFPARTLLSPFDPLVWRRERALRLFDFHYRIEIYVPEPKRVYGYYVLPFLLGEDVVARVDLKADRASGRLLVRGAFAEDGADRGHVARELASELADLGAWLDVREVVVGDRGDLAPQLAAAIG